VNVFQRALYRIERYYEIRDIKNKHKVRLGLGGNCQRWGHVMVMGNRVAVCVACGEVQDQK
jgi:hypothetical protein